VLLSAEQALTGDRVDGVDAESVRVVWLDGHEVVLDDVGDGQRIAGGYDDDVTSRP
jgi:hypothetical protein